MCDHNPTRCTSHRHRAPGTQTLFVAADGTTGFAWDRLTAAQIGDALTVLTRVPEGPESPAAVPVTLATKNGVVETVETTADGDIAYVYGDRAALDPGQVLPEHRLALGTGHQVAAAIARLVALLGLPDTHDSNAAG